MRTASQLERTLIALQDHLIKPKKLMAKSNLFESSYGKEISLEEANMMIEEYRQLDAITSKTVKGDQLDAELSAKANVLINKTYNAFVFKKDLIMRFFDGSETDESGNPESANYIMVILGAHPTKTETHEAGSFTVLTAGCRIDESTEGETRFYPLNIKSPANEYPPTAVITKLGDEKEGQKMVSYFLLAK